ncbi:DUF6480 family protein [Streptomyces caeruleatus]|uniref:Uncharacterized protein n=1 Tax=Streptomyces caeruleatus TaxID=661399 RepID=A0A101U9C3_9ACTN|nr:DUF6480 family protein [Streptomyces caeruleatus]KUO06489.1 hypothetical protein AQJ67_00555 [Streptomyces caeruleatus]
MTNPDPEPTRAPGPRPGSGVPPGETPPAESDSTAGISYPQNELRRGWAAGPLVLIMLVVALVVAGLIAMVVALIA